MHRGGTAAKMEHASQLPKKSQHGSSSSGSPSNSDSSSDTGSSSSSESEKHDEGSDVKNQQLEDELRQKALESLNK